MNQNDPWLILSHFYDCRRLQWNDPNALLAHYGYPCRQRLHGTIKLLKAIIPKAYHTFHLKLHHAESLQLKIDSFFFFFLQRETSRLIFPQRCVDWRAFPAHLISAVYAMDPYLKVSNLATSLGKICVCPERCSSVAVTVACRAS